MSSNDAYEVMTERLGFPGSARLRLILETMATPEQARMVAELPGTPQEVAEKTGIDQSRVKDALDNLFFKGVVFPRGDFRRREYFRFARSITQFHDATMSTRELDLEQDRPLVELWRDFKINELYPHYAERDKGHSKPSLRIVPATKSIWHLDGVLPYENYEEILKAQSRIAVVPCSCRLETTSLGKPCDIHDETDHWACLQSGRAADYAITRGSGKELSLEAALELNDVMEESGLLHIMGNTSAMTDFGTSCNCCQDCCETFVSMDQAGFAIGLSWEKSRYQAGVNLDDCDGCQVCVERCLFDAIEMERPEGSKKHKAVVDADKCFGCGSCAVACGPEAIRMRAVRPPEHIPGAPTT